MLIISIRIAILFVISLGGLFTIIAIAGKEWMQREYGAGTIKENAGLWEGCSETEGLPKICVSIKTSYFKENNIKG